MKPLKKKGFTPCFVTLAIQLRVVSLNGLSDGFYLSLTVMKRILLNALCEGDESAPGNRTILGLSSHGAFWLLCGGQTEVVLLPAVMNRSRKGWHVGVLCLWSGSYSML